MKKLKINVVSEFQYMWKAQGVATAFQTTVKMLRESGEVDVVVNSLKPCDILHAQDSGPFYFALAPHYPGRRVMTAHVVPESFHLSTTGWRYIDPIVSRILVRSYNNVNLLIAIAPGVSRSLVERGVRTKQIMIPNAIDLSHFRPSPELRVRGRASLGLRPDEKVVLGVGLITLRKGFDDFIEVARRNPDTTFVWVGGSTFSVFTDSFFAKYEWMAEAPKNMHFPGIVPFERMAEIYNAADMLFLPTRQETFGLVIAEAAACGLPVLVRDLPEFKEIFDSGYLAADSVEEFSRHIRQAFTDRAILESLKKKSIELASHFDTRVLTKRLVEAYQELYEESKNGKKKIAS